MIQRKTAALAVLLFSLVCFKAASQKSYEFINQSIEEIIFALSLHEGISIVCDDTVRGTASFRYAGSDFNRAFDAFLDSARLYVTKEKDQWTVSKIRVFCDDEGNIQLDCYDSPPSLIFEKISLVSGVTIVYDLIPSIPLSLHVSNTTLKNTVLLILNGTVRYDVIEQDTYIRITKKAEKFNENEAENAQCVFYSSGGQPHMFNALIVNTRAGKAVEELCTAAGKEVIQAVRNDAVIDKIALQDKSFPDLLSVICLQSGTAWVEHKGVYYILPSAEGTAAIKNTGKVWRFYTLQYTSIDAVQNILAQRFPSATGVTINKESVLMNCTDVVHNEIDAFLKTIDIPLSSHLITLKYLKGSEFLSCIPPSFRKEDFKETGDDTKLFFTGTEENYALLLDQLSILDAPVKRITYDLLIIQYQDSLSSSWTPSLKVRPVELGDALLTSAEVGSVMDLQFNVITSFGLTFAAKLNTALTESKAKIFADTTLHGVSGSTIKFQNTSTYRYRDTAVDPDTGKPVYTGVTREIVSGLMLDIEGWVSGDGMVTTKVSASVSKRGADVSNSIGNPPPTYEKVITTQVRSRSGEPVVLSGLVQDDSVLVQERMPLLSKIPLIGYLFTSQSKTNEKTEMVIYLIPHLEQEDTGTQQKTRDLEGRNKSIKRNEAIYHKYITDEDCNE